MGVIYRNTETKDSHDIKLQIIYVTAAVMTNITILLTGHLSST